MKFLVNADLFLRKLVMKYDWLGIEKDLINLLRYLWGNSGNGKK